MVVVVESTAISIACVEGSPYWFARSYRNSLQVKVIDQARATTEKIDAAMLASLAAGLPAAGLDP